MQQNLISSLNRSTINHSQTTLDGKIAYDKKKEAKEIRVWSCLNFFLSYLIGCFQFFMGNKTDPIIFKEFKWIHKHV